jgi:selenocysteine-specific elongation factor
VLATLDDVAVDGGYARAAGSADPLAGHPYLAALAAGGMAPPAPDRVDRAELRELVRRGLVVERDGVCFHADAITAAAALASRLLGERPDGFTVSEFRDAAGVTRKHALPLVNELDARGVTRRRGDVRVAGPRLRG